MTTETPTKPQRPKTKPDPELSAVRRITAVLSKLPVGARQRVLRFAFERVESDAKAAAAAQYEDRGQGVAYNGANLRAAQQVGGLLG